MSELDRSERHEVHNERVIEVQSGRISGAEFIRDLVKQVGLTMQEATDEYNELKRDGKLPKFEATMMVQYPCEGEFKNGIIHEMYHHNEGAVVQTDITNRFSIRVPFATFQLRTVQI